MARKPPEEPGKAKRLVKKAGLTLGAIVLRIGLVVFGTRVLQTYLKRRDEALRRAGKEPEPIPFVKEKDLPVAGLVGLGFEPCPRCSSAARSRMRGGMEEVSV
jgi:hypothetical protein